MRTEGLFGENVQLLEKAMDLRARRHEVLSSNIANIDTPNYKAFDVALEDALATAGERKGEGALRTTHPDHIPGGAGAPSLAAGGAAPVVQADDPAYAPRGDGNTVNLDREMLKISENGLIYSVLTQVTAKEFTGLKTIIEGN